MKKPSPVSCDTFVVVGDDLAPTVFGKNSDRPVDEIHEVVRYAAAKYAPGTVLKCQYIEIPQVNRTHAIVLSRPSWLWGAEMGSNEHGLCAGNEAVWSLLASECDDGVSRLLGMDIVRLVLERAATARDAITVATTLIEAHGQGGGCAEGDSSWCYENSFLFADADEAWVLETAGKSWWAAEQVQAGKYRNISNGLSIRRPDLIHSGLLNELQRRGWWRPISQASVASEIPVSCSPKLCSLDWKAAMVGGSPCVASGDLEPDGREAAGAEWLQRLAGAGRPFGFSEMTQILRDAKSGICMRGGGFASTGSQVSVLTRSGVGSLHFFTTGSDPSCGCYKPFAFSPTASVVEAHDEAEVRRQGDRTQVLWRLHRHAAAASKAVLLRSLEEELSKKAAAGEAVGGALFDEAVEREIKILKG